MTLQEFVFSGTIVQALPYKCLRIDKAVKVSKEIECSGGPHFPIVSCKPRPISRDPGDGSREWTDDKVRITDKGI